MHFVKPHLELFSAYLPHGKKNFKVASKHHLKGIFECLKSAFNNSDLQPLDFEVDPVLPL